MTQLLRGSEVAEALQSTITSEVRDLKARGIEPVLAIVRVGERADDISYERGAVRRAELLGVGVRSVVLPDDCTTMELLEIMEDLSEDDDVHGILLFRPLPAHIDEDAVRKALVPTKDVDGITDLSLAGVFSNTATGFAPCTAQACMEILDYYGIELAGKRTVVVGRSLVVGRPVAMLLLARHATVTIAHSHTADLPGVVKAADLVIACVGSAEMLDASYLAAGQTVIDVGINVAADGSLLGDVSREDAEGIVQAITPVPGGVGTVTTSVLIKNVVEAASEILG
ncbi:MAG: bifunctional 5,10-methylenetetrahydrofolate dehydrogenase/5,10-methenyltetrahydrofolate cyclohydrolase [Coriobacteriales bacterium]|jgi:methylenetetrahydrofolate dehydrogenase (NADP+)/methenyltetrahydrofolate cyclohydrolase|nr:bifunctional 5,10-methylenetetrahydrofolate dehydrogenase/5,10-methenyltetrahydrofolate cyclohydrolase [Coriobacteriales bacterium]